MVNGCGTRESYGEHAEDFTSHIDPLFGCMVLTHRADDPGDQVWNQATHAGNLRLIPF